MLPVSFFVFFFFNDTATTEIYTLSLHDALPISQRDAHAIPRQRLVVDDQGAHAILSGHPRAPGKRAGMAGGSGRRRGRERTPLDSRHSQKSYCGFFFEKKKKNERLLRRAQAHVS